MKIRKSALAVSHKAVSQSVSDALMSLAKQRFSGAHAQRNIRSF